MGFEFDDPDESVADAAADPSRPGPGGAIERLRRYYATHAVPRGGYDQPLPGAWTGPNAVREVTRLRRFSCFT